MGLDGLRCAVLSWCQGVESAEITVCTASVGAFALEFRLVCMKHHSDTAAENTMYFNQQLLMQQEDYQACLHNALYEQPSDYSKNNKEHCGL